MSFKKSLREVHKHNIFPNTIEYITLSIDYNYELISTSKEKKLYEL